MHIFLLLHLYDNNIVVIYVLGEYMYIESSKKQLNDKARLISPLLKKNSPDICVTFWYHMYGQTIGSLNVYAKVGRSPVRWI